MPRKKSSSEKLPLPPVDTVRWTISRKTAVIQAVAREEITVEEVCRRYQISMEEYNLWKEAYEKHGEYGLRTTRIQIYRQAGRDTTKRRHHRDFQRPIWAVAPLGRPTHRPDFV